MSFRFADQVPDQDQEEPTYVNIFPEYLRITLIFTDFPTEQEVGLNHVTCTAENL